MSYLICNKCGGYYELQEGEYSENFSDQCECGGKLEYKKYIIDEKTIYPKSIGTGALIFFTITASTLYIHINSVFMILIFVIALFIGSFVASYYSGLRYKTGIFNGVLASTFGAILLFSMIPLLHYLNYLNPKGSFIELGIGLFIFIILLPVVIGFIGSFTATTLKTKDMKLNWNIFGEGVVLTSILFFVTLIFSPLIIGFFMGIRAGQEHWEGMKHGFLIGSTGTLLASIIAIYAPIAILHKFNLTPNFSPIIIVTTIFLFITMFISGGLLGSLGGYLGVVIKKKSIKKS